MTDYKSDDMTDEQRRNLIESREPAWRAMRALKDRLNNVRDVFPGARAASRAADRFDGWEAQVMAVLDSQPVPVLPIPLPGNDFDVSIYNIQEQWPLLDTYESLCDIRGRLNVMCICLSNQPGIKDRVWQEIVSVIRAKEHWCITEQQVRIFLKQQLEERRQVDAFIVATGGGYE